MYIVMTDLLCCMAETNKYNKAIILKLKKNFKCQANKTDC